MFQGFLTSKAGAALISAISFALCTLLILFSAYSYGKHREAIARAEVTAQYEQQIKAMVEENEQNDARLQHEFSKILSVSQQKTRDAESAREKADAELRAMLKKIDTLQARDKEDNPLFDKNGQPFVCYLGSAFSDSWNTINRKHGL